MTLQLYLFAGHSQHWSLICILSPAIATRGKVRSARALLQPKQMDGDAPSGTPPPEGKQKKPRSRGARLSKAEREARREARQVAASADEQHGEAFETRRAALLGHAAAGEWDAAATLGGATVPLALELFGQLLPRGSPRNQTGR